MKQRHGGRLHVYGGRAWLGLISGLVSLALVWAGLCMLDGFPLDWTAERLSVLSEGTRQTIARMEENGETATIYLVFQHATDSSLRNDLETLASSYARSSAIAVDTIDPVAEPGRVSPYQTDGQSISEGSAIVVCGDRVKVVPSREMYTYAVSSDGTYRISGVSAEQKLTAALRAVTGEGSVRVRFVTGHGEAGMAQCSRLVSRLKQENYDVAETTLGTADALEAGDVALLLSPVRDLTEEEYGDLCAFLDGGGRMLMGMDATVDMDALPRLKQLMARFSLSFLSGVVVEDSKRSDAWVTSPLYLMPTVHRESGAASGMKADWRVITPGSRAVSGPEIPLSGYDYEVILSTSSGSYIKQTDSEAYTREADDPMGEWTLAISAAHAVEGTGQETRAIFLGTLYTLVDNSLMNATYNLELSVNMIGYLAQREDALQVPVRAAADTAMKLPSAQTAWRILALTLSLPVLCALWGAIVMVRRRRR